MWSVCYMCVRVTECVASQLWVKCSHESCALGSFSALPSEWVRYGHAAVLKPRFSVASMLWLHIDREDSFRSKVFMVSIWLRHSMQRRNYLEWPGLGGGWPALLICPLKPGRHIFVNNIAITNDRKSNFFPLINTIILYLYVCQFSSKSINSVKSYNWL